MTQLVNSIYEGGNLSTQRQPGPLVIIGGSEDKDGECGVLAEFIRLAGGSRARIVVIAVASEHPALVMRQYLEIFDWMGAQDAKPLDITRREHANAPAALEAVEKATGVFFTGGNQVRISRVLGGTQMDAVLHRCHEQGMVLAGTSAGAAMMSSIMIIGGVPETTLRLGIVDLAPGLGFISGVVIDQHFEERGRLRRLLSAIAQYPHNLGLGIDEDTAAVVEGDEFRVIGQGAVTVIDAADLSYTNFPGLDKNDLLAMCGVKVHVLPAGLRFDMLTRTPLVKSNSKQKKPSNSQRGHRRIKSG